MNKYKLTLKRAEVFYIPNFLSKEKADLYLQAITDSIAFEKKEYEGRMTALHGDAKRYKYALNDGIPKPWTNELLDIKKSIEGLTGYSYDVCLLNYYTNGKEGFRFHSDREEIGNDTPIASISLGAERKFYFKSMPKKRNDEDSLADQREDAEEYCIVLEHGSLLVMGKGTHENYIHGLPVDKKIKNPRLNLTFRKTRPINNPTLIESKTVVVNKKTTNDYDVYIGRPSKWGNPFKMMTESDRDSVIEQYRNWIVNQPHLLKDLPELKGKRIACFCKPLPCHGDVLAELADKL